MRLHRRDLTNVVRTRFAVLYNSRGAVGNIYVQVISRRCETMPRRLRDAGRRHLRWAGGDAREPREDEDHALSVSSSALCKRADAPSRHSFSFLDAATVARCEKRKRFAVGHVSCAVKNNRRAHFNNNNNTWLNSRIQQRNSIAANVVAEFLCLLMIC